ncbi:MAG TPA: PAS domain S-box protein [Polyangiaceae bacterium]|nr:PAS domain S-box protein [Polyangiaceae bacterium]
MSDDGGVAGGTGAEHLFHQLVDSIPDYAIFMLDPEGRVATWNLGAMRIKGYTHQEIVGKHFGIFYTPEERLAGKPARVLETVRRDGRIEDESWRVRKDGTRFWGNVVITALRDGGERLIGFVKVTRDLTARKLAEEELRTSEERMRLLVECVTDYAIYMLDPEGRVSTWNSGAERMTGYKASEIIGQSFTRFFQPEDARAGKPQIELERARTEGRFEDEAWRVRRDGTRFWANVVLTPMRDAHGDLIGYSKVTRDLSERRSAEETERRLDVERSARAVLEESEMRLKVAVARADAANRVKDEFLATVSHELRTPLNAIVGWSSLLRARTDDPALRKGLVSIHQNAQTQSRLVDDILDVSRVITGKLHLNLSATDVMDVVHQAAEVIRPSADAKQIALRFALPEEPVLLVADSDRLRQVVWNLLSNAVKFTDAGGEVLTTVERHGNELSLSVRDTGQGIPLEFLPHVFERFRQADGSTTRRFGGLGLGLAIVRHVTELHGGRVEAESGGPGRGALFRVTLPIRHAAMDASVAPAEALETRPASQPRRHALGGLRILVVDDDRDAREMLEEALVDAGASVRSADSASQALDFVRSFRPHVIVSDVGMPDEDGYAFMRHVRELGARQGGDVPSIALTGYARHGDKTLAIAAGFTAHVAKPVVPAELVELVVSLADDAGREEASSQ